MNAIRTFASDVHPYPRRRDDWEGIARLAAKLLEQRRQRYPRQIELGNLTQDQADRRIRVMAAIDALWSRVIDRVDLPHPLDCAADLGASLPEMQAEAASARDRLVQFAAARPDDRDAVADRDHGEALWWHLQPVARGAVPHIWQAHGHAQWELARSRGRSAA